MKFFSKEDIAEQFTKDVSPNKWTVIIPAAGRGSRLGYHQPKILYPIAGRMILDWLIDLLNPSCGEFIFVLSPEGSAQVRPFLEIRLNGRYKIIIQNEPRGMADAIYQAVPSISTPYTLIIWGDQVAIGVQTLRNTMKIQQYYVGSAMTFPIVRKEHPYTHYVTDDNGRLTDVLERREGVVMPLSGEGDCGLFAFDSALLQEVFRFEMNRGIAYSQTTKEWNFLPMLPWFDAEDRHVNALRMNLLEESVGVNDVRDAVALEEYLLKRIVE